MSDDFWDGFDFPTLDIPTGSTNSITQPIEQTPSIDTIMPDLKKRAMMVFFIIDISGIDTLQTLVVALGAGLGVWGVVNLLEGYGSDNPGSNAHVR